MKLVFFDAISWDYDAGTPYERPLGGSQSALCYLTAALAARGHDVTLFTGTTQPRVFQGVQCCSYDNLPLDGLKQYEAAVILNFPSDCCIKLRPYLSPSCRLVLWTQHAHDQSAMFELKRAEVRAGWDLIICVSDWHAREMQRHYDLDGKRLAVLRNAIAPAFLGLFADASALRSAKSSEPALAYTSTPYRGLNWLLSLFPAVHRGDERVRLRVYSSMKVYYDDSDDSFEDLYAACRSMAGVEYVGSLTQPLLAQALRSDTILAYPNKFPETSCISVMEAMAAGLLVVTSDLAALPETTMGRAVLVPSPRDAQEAPDFVRAYLDRLTGIIQSLRRDPQPFWAARWEQVTVVNHQCTWPVRAAEWEQLLSKPRAPTSLPP
jgi:glycosyltransferase involved in cell wall biosynthesis